MVFNGRPQYFSVIILLIKYPGYRVTDRRNANTELITLSLPGHRQNTLTTIWGILHH